MCVKYVTYVKYMMHYILEIINQPVCSYMYMYKCSKNINLQDSCHGYIT